MAKLFQAILAFVITIAWLTAATAQTTAVPFGVVNHDASQPVEITSDSFRVSQKDHSAVFAGNVLVGQGDMRLSAEKVVVEYSETEGDETGRIERLIATGGVTLISGAEAAEANSAVYSIDSGNIVMEGNVLLTQGKNALSGQKLIINLQSGSAHMEGRVKTIFQTGSSN